MARGDAKAARLNDNGNFPYLRTHPMTGERIAEMQARQPLGRAAVPQAPSFEHGIMSDRKSTRLNSSH